MHNRGEDQLPKANGPGEDSARSHLPREIVPEFGVGDGDQRAGAVGHAPAVQVGDAELGENVNIGAGTIFCNYDGVSKHKTLIGNNVFIGSNSVLVAPVKLADNAFVAAGSSVNSDVPADTLAVGRAKQRNISGWKRPTKK